MNRLANGQDLVDALDLRSKLGSDVVIEKVEISAGPSEGPVRIILTLLPAQHELAAGMVRKLKRFSLVEVE